MLHEPKRFGSRGVAHGAHPCGRAAMRWWKLGPSEATLCPSVRCDTRCSSLGRGSSGV